MRSEEERFDRCRIQTGYRKRTDEIKISGGRMNNFEKIKSFSKNKMTDFLYALLRSSCCIPKEYDCKKCVAKSLCDVDRKRDSRYSISQWLQQESEG